MLITLESVSKRYGDKTVTDRFSYRFEPGKRYCLFGPSGCGKTTLLRLIAGLETPDGGKVTVEGGPFTMQFQEDRLLPWHKVLKNLTYTMDEQTAMEALREAGLENEADRRPGELSGGMRRRLSLMRALKSPSEAVLLDEPVRELDTETADRMLDVIDRETRGKLLILVTHDRSQAERLGCTVIELKKNRTENEEATGMNGKIRIAIPGYEKKTVNYRNALASLGAEAECVETPTVEPEKYDGMLLPGGGDMDPARYGRQDEGSEPPDTALDERQIAAFEAFRAAGKPILGICRGIQVINVCMGGTLIQDIPQKLRHSRMGGPDDKVHLCTAEENSVMHALYGKSFLTNSAHHQAIENLGQGLKVTLWSDDGIVEAVEHETEPIWGVQWHPERMCFALKRNDGSVDGKEILQAFLDLCAQKSSY